MSKLNGDVLYLILNELQDDKKALRSCLSVNKFWCEIIVPILWKNPWKHLRNGEKRNMKLLLDVIILHLSKNSRDNLTQHYKKNSYKRPLFDYISFCRHLNFTIIKSIVNNFIDEKTKIPIIENEILDLFINNSTNFTHLYIPHKFDHQTSLIPGAESSLSELKFLSFSTNINDDVIAGLIELCGSVNELEFFIATRNNNHGIIKLIETCRKLFSVHLIYSEIDESFCKILENSLILHSKSIQYLKITKQPITEFLSSFVNLKSLELDDSRNKSWKCLENLSFPYLQSLKTSRVPINVLINLIENTSGYLTEIKIDRVRHDEINNEKIIRCIYQNCPMLKYLKLLFINSNFLELENLLIYCQYLKGLYIIFEDAWVNYFTINWNHLFEILTKSSPDGLFKFKFYCFCIPKLESLKLFFDNWKGKQPMLLQTTPLNSDSYDLIEKYKIDGVVKKYSCSLHNFKDDDFEWN
ncbi:hypothetical protein RclHR1_01810005 [Rhizophagus clarus]|uniref:F-box domain-containing protein n=1 Tax=Rhizophagus clarus TaxID=94130 RepID=A0A2Z6QQS8_9GLOM|nr:hypothetical protein RclHR1_01810005 [Rhizophagus clarus]GES75223.1 hypothetical protein GLOIN_2v1867019 [Rhizophagus clarus]